MAKMFGTLFSILLFMPISPSYYFLSFFANHKIIKIILFLSSAKEKCVDKIRQKSCNFGFYAKSLRYPFRLSKESLDFFGKKNLDLTRIQFADRYVMMVLLARRQTQARKRGWFNVLDTRFKIN